MKAQSFRCHECGFSLVSRVASVDVYLTTGDLEVAPCSRHPEGRVVALGREDERALYYVSVSPVVEKVHSLPEEERDDYIARYYPGVTFAALERAERRRSRWRFPGPRLAHPGSRNPLFEK